MIPDVLSQEANKLLPPKQGTAARPPAASRAATTAAASAGESQSTYIWIDVIVVVELSGTAYAVVCHAVAGTHAA